MGLRSIAIYLLIDVQAASAAPMVVTPGDLGSYKVEIEVLVDGVPKPFQLDTGANTTTLTGDKQTKKYHSEGKSVSTGAAGIPVECDLVRPSHVAFDRISLERPQLRRCDLGQHGFNNLGLDLLNNAILHLDFKRSLFTIEEAVPVDRTFEKFIRLPKGHLKLPVKLTGQSYNGVFDTGAQLSSVDLKFARENPDLFKFIRSDEVGRDIGGNPVLMHIFELQELQVGSLNLKKITVLGFEFGKLREYLGADTPFILGTNAIIKADWHIDLITNQWAVQPHQPDPAAGHIPLLGQFQ